MDKDITHAYMVTPLNSNAGSAIIQAEDSIVLGTGEGSNYCCKLDGLLTRAGEETCLYRVMSEGEYQSIISNGNRFVQYDYAMEMKWFALCYEHAVAWAKELYKDNKYRILEVTVLQESLKYMFYAKALDNIGPAYSCDVDMLNKIVRKVRLA